MAKRILAYVGVNIYRSATLPRGFDLFADLKRLNYSPAVIFDVGANVGTFSRTAFAAFPVCEIYAFEPVSETFAHLEQLARRKSRIHAQNIALGEKIGKATVHLRSNPGWNSLLPLNNTTQNSIGRSEEVMIATVDSICDGRGIERIDLLKTDTEGYDLKVLEGAAKMFNQGRVRAVYSEVTFLGSDNTHTKFAEVSDFLKALGFAIYGFYEWGGDLETGYASALFLRRTK